MRNCGIKHPRINMNAKFVELQRICNQQCQGENYYWNTERTVSDWKKLNKTGINLFSSWESHERERKREIENSHFDSLPVHFHSILNTCHSKTIENLGWKDWETVLSSYFSPGTMRGEHCTYKSFAQVHETLSFPSSMNLPK